MPQMMPINWLFQLIFFIFIFLLFNIMNYYIFYNISFFNKKMNFIKPKSLNWKW